MIALPTSLRLMSAAAASALLAGCSSSSPTIPLICPALGVAAVVVTVADATTGATFPFTGVSAVAVSGTYRDSAFVARLSDAAASSAGIALAFSHPGTFAIEVRADGYALWRRSDVVVTHDECGHPITQSVQARLSRM